VHSANASENVSTFAGCIVAFFLTHGGSAFIFLLLFICLQLLSFSGSLSTVEAYDSFVYFHLPLIQILDFREVGKPILNQRRKKLTTKIV